MDTNVSTTESRPEITADAQAVIEQALSGQPIDPAAADRVHECAKQIRRDILAKHGVLDAAVDLIRETRDEA